MSGYFWDSKKTGSRAECILKEILRDNKNKLKYSISTLDEFSTIQNKLLVLKEDVIMLKYFLEISLNATYRRVETSTLLENEKSHLKNALHTRYMKFIRKHKIPMNKGKCK